MTDHVLPDLVGKQMAVVIGSLFIAYGVAILVRHALRIPPEIIGRNEAMKRILRRAS